MQTTDREAGRCPAARTGDAGGASPAALWTALRAEHRARDERTARLRAMRLIAGEAATG